MCVKMGSLTKTKISEEFKNEVKEHFNDVSENLSVATKATLSLTNAMKFRQKVYRRRQIHTQKKNHVFPHSNDFFTNADSKRALKA